MKAAQVGAGEYDARIRRADHLASKHPFATEVLRFYSRVAEFQKNLYTEITKGAKYDIGGNLHATPGPIRLDFPVSDAIKLLSSFTSFLTLIAEAAPPALAAAARTVFNLDARSRRSLLSAYLEVGGINDPLIGPFSPFISRAFAHPHFAH